MILNACKYKMMRVEKNPAGGFTTNRPLNVLACWICLCS